MRVAVKIGGKDGLSLATARNEECIGVGIQSLYILDKGTGNFVLKFQFLEQKLLPLELDQSEVNNADELEWDVLRLLITNTAQAGKSLKLIIEKGV